MAGPERNDEAANAVPEAPVKRVKGLGLSPAVEKMFGALVDEQGASGTQSTAEPEARCAPRPGAA